MQLISLFLLAVVTCVILLLICTGFGFWILGIFDSKKKFSALAQCTIANLLAFSSIGTLFFTLGHIFDIYVYYVFYPVAIIGIVSSIKNKEKYIELFAYLKEDLRLTLFGTFSALVMAATLAGSWIQLPDGLYTQSGQLHDSVWHIAVINNLLESIPPLHPSNYESTLTHYHYFYDIIIAGIEKAFFIPATILYFQVLPFYLAFLLFFSALTLGQTFKNKQFEYLLLLFTFYGGGFTYVLPFLIEGHTGHESSFWVSQTFAMMINPQLIYSFSLLFIVLFLIRKVLDEKTISLNYHFLILFLSITSIGFKSYSFVVLLMLYSLTLAYLFFIKKNSKYIALFITTIVTSLPLYLMVVGNQGNGTFFFHPLWYIDTMIETSDRLNYIRLRLIEDHYRSLGEFWKVYIIKAIEIVIFYLGNLGTRAVLFLLPLFYFSKKINHNVKLILTLLSVSFIITSVFPLLFLQIGVVWNSIQFWYYALILANVAAALVLAEIFRYLKDSNRRYLYLTSSIVLVGLTIISYWQTVPKKIMTYDRVPVQTLEMLKELGTGDKVLVCPSVSPLYTTSLIAGFTSAKTYFVNRDQLALTGSTDLDQREEELKRLFDGQHTKELERFIEEKDITTVICNSANPALLSVNTAKVLYSN